MQVVKSLISKDQVHKKNVNLMGTPFEISVVTTDAFWAEGRVKSAIAEIKRIDRLLSTLRAGSQASLINHSAGIAPVKISGELYRLIDRSLKIAKLTGGGFDITYGTNNGYNELVLNAAENTVFLKEKGTRIYFGGIAKGYAIDRAKYVMQMEGVGSGVINAGGTLTAWGVQADGNNWTIGAADPGQEAQPYAEFAISNMAIASSLKQNNNRHDNVCVMGTSAELAGAMTCTLVKLGAKAGIELVNNLQQLACVFVNQNGQMFASKYMDALN